MDWAGLNMLIMVMTDIEAVRITSWLSILCPAAEGKGAISVAFVRPSVCLSVRRIHSE